MALLIMIKFVLAHPKKTQIQCLSLNCGNLVAEQDVVEFVKQQEQKGLWRKNRREDD